MISAKLLGILEYNIISELCYDNDDDNNMKVAVEVTSRKENDIYPTPFNHEANGLVTRYIYRSRKPIRILYGFVPKENDL